MATANSHDDFHEMFGDSDSGEDDFEGFEDEVDDFHENNEDLEGLEQDGLGANVQDEWHSVNVSGVGPRGAAESQPDLWLPQYFSHSGPSIDFTSTMECDYFMTVFPPEVILFLVEETNRYADTFYNESIDEGTSIPEYLQAWKAVTEIEMKAFLAIIFYMGVEVKPNFKFYWTTHWLFCNSGFKTIMPRDRFILILKFFHCCDNSKAVKKGKPGYDRCFKIRGLLNLLLPFWQNCYNLGQNISIDEGMVAFRGRVNIIQYMPKKPIKWGLKAWILSDAKTAYTYKWDLYAGKDEGRDKTVSLSEKVIIDLVSGLENKGHVVFCDNFYTSPRLFLQLAGMGTGACGTVRVNRKGMPAELKPVRRKHKITEKEPGPLFFRKEKLLACAWYDKRAVYILSTIHDSSVIQKKVRAKLKDSNNTGYRIVQKPKVIDQYNSNMAGVDKGDQLFTYYGFQRRSLKWWKKIAFHFMEVAMVNAWIMYQHNNPGKESLQFRIAVIEGLLEGYSRKIVPIGRPVTDTPLRLTGRHFSTKIERTTRPDCRVCSNREIKKRRQTSFECLDCNAALCPAPCFKLFHTIVDYKDYFDKNYRN